MMSFCFTEFRVKRAKIMDHSVNPNQRIGPERNLAYLRETGQLRRTEPSCDLSEVSYQTEHTDFPNSRNSSINAEPLTLDADQIHDAKDQAADVLKHNDPETAFGIFTKDLSVRSDEAISPEIHREALVQQFTALEEKAQEVVNSNQQTYGKCLPGAMESSSQLDENFTEDGTASTSNDQSSAGDGASSHLGTTSSEVEIKQNEFRHLQIRKHIR